MPLPWLPSEQGSHSVGTATNAIPRTGGSCHARKTRARPYDPGTSPGRIRDPVPHLRVGAVHGGCDPRRGTGGRPAVLEVRELRCERQSTSGPWLATLNIQGDASLPAHFDGLNISLDGGPVHGIATEVYGGFIQNKIWRVKESDAFVAWIAARSSLSVTTLFEGEGVAFDVSEVRLFAQIVPERCRW